jgi:EAL domain-containing protein (putative c-di-GMP-specific phosphodiesterase class I)
LREALEQEQFELHYQPQIDIASGRVQSVEALLRWNDPEHGMVLPARFLPILESSGLIIQVGNWVVQKAAQECERWQRLGLGPVRVAVNVSPLQIRRRAFTERVLELALRWPGGAQGYGIDLEITETALLADIEATERRLRELRAAGIRIALDDFGTGYSSLGLLSKLPVDLIKIDRSFVRGLPGEPASVALTRSIIGLASAFGLKTVAEGVEMEEQLQTLRELGCTQSQGYLHARPLPAAQIERLLRERA